MARLCRLDLIHHQAHRALCALWIGLAVAFLWLASEAFAASHTRLPRSGFRIPSRPNVQVGNLRFQEVINDLADKYDQTAALIEQSIRRSARRTLCLYLGASFLSLLGSAAQWQRFKTPLAPSSGPDRLDHAPIPVNVSRPTPPLAPVAAIHDGSFPEGGYSH